MTRSRLGLLPVIFHKFVTVMTLDVRILFPLNIFRAIPDKLGGGGGGGGGGVKHQ